MIEFFNWVSIHPALSLAVFAGLLGIVFWVLAVYCDWTKRGNPVNIEGYQIVGSICLVLCAVIFLLLALPESQLAKGNK